MPRHIPSLDGLRAVSIAIVLMAHLGWPLPVPGNFGVTVFFFLSGFLITTLLRLEFDRTRTINLKDFYIRRAYRIWPAFYLVLALACLWTALGWVEGPQLDGWLVGWQALHLANYAVIGHGWWEGRSPGTGVYWSLAVEEHFYLAFPLLYGWMLRRGTSRDRQALVILGLCLAALAWRMVLVYGLDAPKDRTYVATDTRFDSILWGCLLAIHANPVLDPPRFTLRQVEWIGLPLGLLLLGLSLAPGLPTSDQAFRYTLQGLALVPLFVAAIRNPGAWPWRWLNLGPVRYLGVLSYVLYLVHNVVIEAVGAAMGRDSLWNDAIAVALSLGLSWAIHVYVEKPFNGLRRRHSHVPAVAGSDR